MPPGSAAFWGMQLLALLSALALLVCNAAAGLASRLAGGLALATTAVLSTVAQVASLNGLDMFHGFTFYFEIYAISLAQSISYVNHIFHTFQAIPHKEYRVALPFSSVEKRFLLLLLCVGSKPLFYNPRVLLVMQRVFFAAIHYKLTEKEFQHKVCQHGDDQNDKVIYACTLRQITQVCR